MDAIDPQVHVLFVRERPLFPAHVLGAPDLFQPPDRAGGQPGSVRPEERGEGLAEVPRGDPLEIQPRQQLLERLRAPEVRGEDRRGETDRASPVAHPGGLDRNRADPGLDRTLRPIAIPDHPLAAHVIAHLPILCEKLRYFAFDGLDQQLSRSLPKDFGQCIPDSIRDPWILQRHYCIVSHNGVFTP